MIDDIDNMTIEKHKENGDWPIDWLPVKSLIPYIKRLGSCEGLEIGIARGESSFHILDKCENVKKLYGLDPYPEYDDWNRKVTIEESLKTKDIMEKNMVDFIESGRFIPYYVYSENKDVVEGFDRGSLGFVFVDGDHSYEGAKRDFHNYYSKVRQGGLFSGHDYNLVSVRRALEEFREEQKIRIPINIIDNNTWFWSVL